MIDFKALMNRTPEERAAADEKLRLDDIERASRVDALIAERVLQVEQLSEVGALTPFERQFVGTMSARGRGFDMISGKLGGRLAFLSDKETPIFERLVREHLGQAVDDTPGPVVPQARG